MKKLIELCELCDASVHINFNQHKAYYESVLDCLGDDVDDIYVDEVKKMIELDRVYELQFYPNTPNGFYRLFGHDIEKLIDDALCIARKAKNED